MPTSLLPPGRTEPQWEPSTTLPTPASSCLSLGDSVISLPEDLVQPEGSVWVSPSAPAAWDSGLCSRVTEEGQGFLGLAWMRCPFGPSILTLILIPVSGGEGSETSAPAPQCPSLCFLLGDE